MSYSNTFRIVLACSLVFLAACGNDKSNEAASDEVAPTIAAADFVFTNGKVYTVDQDNSWAQAVTVRGNEIVYVGDNAGAAAFVGDGTESIDLGGKLMLPGFVEGHFHATFPGILTQGVDLQSESMDELLGKLKAYAEANPDKDQIHGWGVRPTLYEGEVPRRQCWMPSCPIARCFSGRSTVIRPG